MHLLLIGVDCRRCEGSVDNTVEENSCSFSLIRMQWCSGKYLFGRTHGERGARAYNGGLGAEPPVGSSGRAPGGVSGGQSPPEAEKVLRFGHAMETANLPYNSLYFGN